MNSFFKPKTLSILLALTINALPLTRLITTSGVPARPSFAVVFQWVGISAALVGSYDAVSGASTIITSPNQVQGKVGEPFSYRVTTAPDQANIFKADSLPPGLAFGEGRRRSFIEGTPTQAGTYSIMVTASDDNRPSRTVTKRITAVIEGNIIPLEILEAPADQTVKAGEPAFLTVLAVGEPPLTYKWYHNNNPLDAPSAGVLKIASANDADAGTYRVDITNASGTVSSRATQLTVTTPTPAAPATIRNIAATQEGVRMEISGTPGKEYVIEYRDRIGTGVWHPLRTFVPDESAVVTVTDSDVNQLARYYRVVTE